MRSDMAPPPSSSSSVVSRRGNNAANAPNTNSSSSTGGRKGPPPPCHYPLLGQITAVLCGLDMVVTTLLLLCNTGTPVFSDWAHLWQTQVTHFKYAVSVSDVWLLSLFRAGPGTWVLWTLRERRREGKKALRRQQQKQQRRQRRRRNQDQQQAKQEGEGGGSGVAAAASPPPPPPPVGGGVRRQLTLAAAFMVFKTWLSFLALFGKSSVFRAWDEPVTRATLLAGLVLAGIEALLTLVLLVGVRRDPDLLPPPTSGLRAPLLGGESKGDADVDVEAGVDDDDDDEVEDDEDETQDKKKKKGGASVGRLLALSRPERPLIVVGTVALLLSSLSTMVLPTFIGRLIDDVGGQGGGDKGPAAARHDLDTSTGALLAILLVGSLFTFVRGYCFNLAGERLVARVRQQLFKAVIAQDIAFFDSSKTGELMNRLAADTTVIQNACTSNVSMLLRFTFQVLLSVFLLFITSWRLSLVMMAVVPVLVVVTRVYGLFVRRFSKQYQDALAGSSEVAQEALGSIRTVHSFAADKVESARYGAKVQESYRLGRKKAVLYGIFTGGIGALAYCAMLTVLWYGGRLVISGEMSPGTLTSFLLYTVYIATGLSVLSGLISEWMQAIGASTRMFELLDREPAIPLRRKTAPTDADARPLEGHVALEGVTFAYPTRPDVQVLRDFTLRVAPNTTVALVGQSGSGKSTTLALLQRFYDPQAGRVLVDGRDIRDLDLAAVRSQMAVVSQEPVLFGCSIRDNITYGVAAAHGEGSALPSQEEVERVARLANAHDFIMSFPTGYDTLVGERGIQLSGGQKQRVAIARALLMDPRILLLDEATSALDAESEHLVQEAIDRIMVGRTTLVIAHRLSTVRNASTIVVMGEGGAIKDMGTHAELMQKSDIYRKLVKRQIVLSDDGEKEKEKEKEKENGDEAAAASSV